MKYSKLLVLAAFPLLIAGCNNEPATSSSSGTSVEPPTSTSTTTVPPSSSSSEEPVIPTVNINMKGLASDADYNLTFEYEDEWFKGDAKEENEGIKLLSFASSVISEKPIYAEPFYRTMGYDNLFFSGYEEITEDTIGYCLAHKEIDGFNLVALSIRGLDYGKEWANNFLLGAEGNHAGFELRVNEIYDSLKIYLASYIGNFKLWITGYSRAGGISNMLASKLLKERDEIIIDQKDLFVYTFEAPRGLTEENAVEYPNVINYVNSMDFVPKIAPEEYGLYRCGRDIIYNEGKDMDEVLNAFDPNISVPAFTPIGDRTDEVAFVNYYLSALLEKVSDETKTLDTRQAFYDNYQPHISYIMGIFFTLNSETMQAIADAFSNLDAGGILALLSDEDGLYNFLSPILDEHSVIYDEDSLKGACNAAVGLIVVKFIYVLDFVDLSAGGLNQAQVNNLKRVGLTHLIDVVYAYIR